MGCNAFRAVVIVFAFTAIVSANAGEHKRVTLAQAWKICKEDVDKNVSKGFDHSTQRYQRAGACMKKFGYPI
jgi:hypothetical protein